MAVVTGRTAGIVVVDVDLPKGAESLAALEARGLVLPATLTARTGGGGLHLVYGHPGLEVRNRAGGLPGAGRLPGIDVRGDGGYVVVAPSRHRSGGSYTWEDPTAPVAPWPEWMVDRPRLVPDGPRRATGPLHAGGSRYGLAALDRELEELRSAPVGERNARLNQAAWSLGMLVAGGELEEAVVVEQLEVAAAAVGLDEDEVIPTIRSGLTAGMKRPRTRPNLAVRPP